MSERNDFEMWPRVRRAVRYALQRKAGKVTVLDLRHLSSATDFFVIATGRSDVQVRAIAEHIIDSAKRDGNRPEHVEGLDQGRWVLLDYIDYVVHIFHPAVRDFYRLETLWGDAKSTVIEEDLSG
ncbi:MAG: ribosome silencing factor [Gemmatimonadetes bacterium]|nr:ribosome silencing factor [Gemmatimonadota bacterium]